jgi:hypothetical protein
MRVEDDLLLQAEGVGVEAVEVDRAPVVEGDRHLQLPVGEDHAHQLAPYPPAALTTQHHVLHTTHLCSLVLLAARLEFRSGTGPHLNFTCAGLVVQGHCCRDGMYMVCRTS